VKFLFDSVPSFHIWVLWLPLQRTKTRIDPIFMMPLRTADVTRCPVDARFVCS